MDTIDPQWKHTVTNIAVPRSTNSQSTTVRLGDAWLESVDIFWLPGHVGLTGIRIQYGGDAIVPWNQLTQFIVGDNQDKTFQVGMYVPGPITVVTQNTDTFAHSFRLTWKWQEYWKSPAVQPNVPLAPLVLS